MIKYEDNLAARINGNNLQPLAGAEVRVTDKATGLPAALYQDDELTPIPQPLITTNTGYFSFKAANGEYLLSFSPGPNSSRFDGFTRDCELYDADDVPNPVSVVLSSLGAEDGAGKVGYGSRTVSDKLGEVVSVKDFGAKGDGVTDDTAALQAALTFAATNKLRLHGIGGATYKVTAPLSLSAAIDFDMRGDTIDGRTVPAGVALNQSAVLTVKGSIGASVAVTSDVSKGVGTIAVASTSGFAAGDYFLLSSDQLMVDGYGNASSLRGEINRVQTASGNTLGGASWSLFSYASASNAKVQRIAPAFGVNIRNGRILAGGVGSWHTGLKLEYCVGFDISNLDVIGGEDVGISTFYCCDGVIRGGHIEDCTNPTGGMASDNGTGYGVCLYYATRNVILDGIHFRNCKRAVTGGARYPSVFNTTRNCTAEGGRNGFGTHEPCWWWVIEDCVARGMTGVGANVRGQFNKLARNRFIDCDSFGIQVRTFYPNPSGLRGVELVDNYMERTAGILLDGDATDGRVIDATISGGDIRDAEFNSITIRRADNVIVRGVRVTGQTTPGSADGNGIIISGSTTAGDRCTNIQIDGVQIKDAARYGIKVSYADRIAINGTTVGQAQRDGVYADSCTDLSISGGFYKGGVVNFTYGIRALNCLRTTVNGVILEGNSDASQTGNHGIVFTASGGACTDNAAVGNTVRNFASAVLVIGTGVDYSLVTGNNGRGCYGATKFNVTSASQVVANNLA